MRTTGVFLAILPLATVVACSGDPSSPADSTGRPPVSGEALYAYPFETLEDWVSYSDAVVVATVTGEERVAPGPEQADAVARGEGVLIGRRLTVEVKDFLWQHPSVSEIPETFSFVTSGWVLLDSEEVPFDYEDHQRLEVGLNYVMPLHATGEVGAIARGVLLTDPNGRVSATADGGSDELATEQLAGLSPDEIADRLKGTAPHPVAEANRELDVNKRYQAVIDAEETAID